MKVLRIVEYSIQFICYKTLSLFSPLLNIIYLLSKVLIMDEILYKFNFRKKSLFLLGKLEYFLENKQNLVFHYHTSFRTLGNLEC